MHSSSLLQFQQYYLVGIKGVAMTSLAECLIDAGKTVRGSDVDQDFVTQPHLDRLGITAAALNAQLPLETECLIYTAAHQGPQQQQVLEAKNRGLTTLSHADALGQLFNQQDGVAVCGVGGKSTISGMITWIFETLHQPQSYSVGVGEILGLEATGHWRPNAQYFIAEADDYVVDPAAPGRGEPMTPRFSFLRPKLTVCSNLRFDHPDVYRDFNHTQEVFGAFFKQIKPGGYLLVNGDDQPLVTLAKQQSVNLVTYGTSAEVDARLEFGTTQAQTQSAQLQYQGQSIDISLSLPGKFNLMNAAAAITATAITGVDPHQAAAALQSFRSTKRRFELLGQKNGVWYYDDYAHHPHEVAAVIKAIQEWHPDSRVVVAFQSHTYSRTKALFDEFVSALSLASEVLMIDIFASAREAFDPTVSSDTLCQAISSQHPEVSAQNLHTIEALAEWCHRELHPGDVFITIGAGDIYLVHNSV